MFLGYILSKIYAYDIRFSNTSLRIKKEINEVQSEKDCLIRQNCTQSSLDNCMH
jgi:hypothetical protein